MRSPMRADVGIRRALALLLVAGVGVSAAASSALAQPSGAPKAIEVSPAGPVRTIADALRRAAPGATIIVHPGVYREPTIVVDKPVTIVGDRFPVLDGEGQRQIMTVVADDVTVRGLRFRDVGTTFNEDRAAIRLSDVRGCVVENNRVDDGFFGIYLARVSHCRIVGNVLHATRSTESMSGNGIHLWYSDDVTITDNRIQGHRDGIYFEFVRDADVRRNISEGNLRYGLHFMYSDGCRYVGNTFRHNGSGVAVMYTKRVEMTGNDFDDNWGAAAYGLLLKEITDVRVQHNRFRGNTTALFLDGATRPVVSANEFTGNGWAVRLDANTQDGRFTGNDFAGNTFDVTTNGRSIPSTFDGNFWDEYGGYDLNHDGVGDVPHRPVRLFSVIVERNEPALIFLRSFFVGALDAAERVVPSLTPETQADLHPSMRPVHPWHPSR